MTIIGVIVDWVESPERASPGKLKGFDIDDTDEPSQGFLKAL